MNNSTIQSEVYAQLEKGFKVKMIKLYQSFRIFFFYPEGVSIIGVHNNFVPSRCPEHFLYFFTMCHESFNST